MIEAKQKGPWTYDFDWETVLDAEGTIIGRMERDSGPLAAAAPDMLKALIEISVFAEMQIEDICADIQEGGLDAVSKMELARWQSVGRAIAKATGAA